MKMRPPTTKANALMTRIPFLYREMSTFWINIWWLNRWGDLQRLLRRKWHRWEVRLKSRHSAPWSEECRAWCLVILGRSRPNYSRSRGKRGRYWALACSGSTGICRYVPSCPQQRRLRWKNVGYWDLHPLQWRSHRAYRSSPQLWSC